MRGKRIIFLSYTEASRIVVEMEVECYKDYLELRKHIQGLPSNPKKFYKQEFLGWNHFTGGRKKYLTVSEAREAVVRLGIKSWSQYYLRYKEDPKLPGNPQKFYLGTFNGFYDFSGRAQKKLYSTIAAASSAVVRLGIKSSHDYRMRFRQDPALPATPRLMYADEWIDWSFFLKVDTRRKFGKVGRSGKLNKFDNGSKAEKGEEEEGYKTCAEFVSEIRKLGITSLAEFNARKKENPKFKWSPKRLYGDEWVGWAAIFDRPYSKQCVTWQEAKKVALPYRATSKSMYEERCLDDRLPIFPKMKYKNFPGWVEFLLPERYVCLENVRCAVKILGITNSEKYREVRKERPLLPSHPERMFSDEWVDWYELCDIPRPYSYDELCEVVRLSGCARIKDYQKLRLNDPRIPASPEEVYPQWRNWHALLDKEEPYTLAYIRGCGVGWIPSLKLFLKKQRAGQIKEMCVCRFIRHFIEAYQLGSSPAEFLTRKVTDIRPFRELIKNQSSGQAGRNLLSAVNAYLNEILIKELTIEDDETGELVRVDGANNPFSTLEYTVSDQQGWNESTKPALAFQYVDAMKKWMVPENAKDFSDLTGVHQFDADYFEVEESLIDRYDPDCVFRIQGNKTLLWFPVHWMHAYTLVSIPARGRQIAYNDSGEADEYIADIEADKIVFAKNMNLLAQSKRKLAFVQYSDDGFWGMHFTSNKTSYMSEGYDVPWIPEKLIYWMIKLRKWQEKYNPIKRPMPWSECKRTNLNEEQLKRKGSNCFLFRSFNEEEPGAYQAKLAERLAAALYLTQPKNLTLATLEEGGNKTSLSSYKSKYTPHSMRVSLITAYVMEFGLPIEIIMKLAGHASIVMSIYYVKIGAAFLRRRMGEGEKLALKGQAYAAQEMLEQNRLDELTHELVANSEQALQVLRAGNIGSTLVRDYGLCPYAAARCDDGGPVIKPNQMWQAVPAGYLGMQNCVRCRHFITGPMFLGGLVSLWNEISLRITFLSEHYFDFEKEIGFCLNQIKEQDDLEYDLERSGGIFDSKDRNRAELEVRKLQSEKESVAKKMDMYLCDLQMLTKQINECKALALQSSKTNSKVQLIVQDNNEIVVEFAQTSFFQQLNEVCVNASIFQSASADYATPRRSQMIDRMALINKIRPTMCTLSEKEQLIVGNQMIKFLLQRLKTWERVDQLVDGKVLLAELSEDERISKEEMSEIMTCQIPQLLDLKEVWNDAR